MPSPIAHAFTGYAIASLFPQHSGLGLRSRQSLQLYGMFVAAAPDLDFMLQLATGVKYHRGFTHSIAFAIVFSVCFWGFGRLRWKRCSGSFLVLTLLLYGSHLLLDLISEGRGIQLLWPLTARYLGSPITLFPSTYWSEPLFQHPGHLKFLLIELGYSILLTAIVQLQKRKKTPKTQKLEW